VSLQLRFDDEQALTAPPMSTANPLLAQQEKVSSPDVHSAKGDARFTSQEKVIKQMIGSSEKKEDTNCGSEGGSQTALEVNKRLGLEEEKAEANCDGAYLTDIDEVSV
jgi:hypothetical protein